MCICVVGEERPALWSVLDLWLPRQNHQTVGHQRGPVPLHTGQYSGQAPPRAARNTNHQGQFTSAYGSGHETAAVLLPGFAIN